jgi:3-hydroxybutyrate dehydrogenase
VSRSEWVPALLFVLAMARAAPARGWVGWWVRYNGADMSKPKEIKQMIDETAAALGGVDVLVNNAGIQHVAAIEDFPEETYEKIIAINLSSAFYTTKYCVPLMKRAGWGRIVNVASAHAKRASPFKSAYVAAKHGLAGLTKTTALELGPHKITANAVCPGYVRTELVEKQIGVTARARGISEEEVVSKVMLGNQPTGEFVGIDELGALVDYLCSDQARSVNGSIISIDGGWTAK